VGTDWFDLVMFDVLTENFILGYQGFIKAVFTAGKRYLSPSEKV
jgi:hypothetical protein